VRSGADDSPRSRTVTTKSTGRRRQPSTLVNANARFYSAMASANEVLACLDVAHRFGYVARVDAGLRDKLDRIIATMRKLTRRPTR